ncbi:hypothetical protein Tco_0895227, partial [Tanacetum coccineum]
MVLLRGEIYFVQLILNPEEDEFETRLIFGRSFFHSTNAIVNFGECTITIQPDFEPFLLSSDEEGKPNLDDLETLLDFDIDEVPQTETDLPPMEAEKRALTHNISMRYEILEEVRPVIETLAYNDKYRKLLDEIWADKIRLDGMIKPEEEKAMAKMKGQMLKEKKDPGAFIFPIRLEGRINENALADTGSDTNTMPYKIYEQLGRDDIMKEDRNITMINYTEAEVTVDQDAPIVVGHGFLDTIGCNINIPDRIFTTFDGCTRQTFRAGKSEKIRIAESDSDDEEDYVIKRNDMGTPIHNSRPIGYQNNTLSTLESTSDAYDLEVRSSRAKRSRNVETVEEALLPDVQHEFLEWRGCSRKAKSRYNSRAFNIREPIYLELCHEFYATYKFDEVCAGDELQSKKIIRFRLGRCAYSITLLEFARRLICIEDRHQKGMQMVAGYLQNGGKGKGRWKLEGPSQICCGPVHSKIARKSRVTEETYIKAKSRSVDRGFVTSVGGGGVGVNRGGGCMKDGNECGMDAYTGDDSV